MRLSPWGPSRGEVVSPETNSTDPVASVPVPVLCLEPWGQPMPVPMPMPLLSMVPEGSHQAYPTPQGSTATAFLDSRWGRW